MKKAYWAAGLAAILLLVAWGFFRKVPDNNDIRFAFVGPLSGDLAVYGEIEKNSTELAVDEINQAGGIGGRKIDVSYQDDKCSGKDALSIVQKSIALDRTKIFLVTCSQSILPIAPVTEAAHAIVFGSYAASSAISNAGDYVFRNAYSNRDIGEVGAETVHKKHQSIAIITEITDYSADLRDTFKSEYSKLGGTILAEENFEPGIKDFRTIVSRLLTKKPEAIFVNPTGEATGLPLLEQLRNLGYKGDLYGNFFGSGKNVQASPYAEGMTYFADPTVADSPLKAAFMQKYAARYGAAPEYDYPAAARYDSIYILKQAIEHVGDDPARIKDYFYAMPDFTGILGTYRFDANGDITNVRPVVKQIVNGVPVEAK